MTRLVCLACGGTNIETMGSVGPVPVLCGSLWESRDEALGTPTAHLDLAVCHSCALVWNTTFDPSLMDYDVSYDNALDFSPTFRAYSDDLVAYLVGAYHLRGSRVAEIGSGKGDFLRALCQAGSNSGVGYDPTYEGSDRDGEIEFRREFFKSETVPEDLDFVACRHVLEHLAAPADFLADVRRAVGDRPVPMYFEVPNAEFNFAESGPWDLIYPHVAYFNESSLQSLLTRAGFRVLAVRPMFNGQFLAAEVVADRAVEPHTDLHAAATARDYIATIDRQVAEAQRQRDRLRELAREGAVALWGAGSKGVTFLSLVDHDGSVGTVVDINPRKWGRFLPPGGHEVVSSAEVAGRGIRSVLVMNPVYETEIRRAVSAAGSRARVLLV